MADKHKWEFKARFRRHAYGWKGTAPASKRLREATREIKKVAKKDPVLAADGSVGLMERLWPALQDIDTSSGYLGDAVFSALDKLIPILVDAPADIDVRRAWLERLYEAVQEDGVSYLDPAEERWGEICVFPELQNEWADRVIPLLRLCWSDESPGFARGSDICLSCLLEAGRYSELEELLGMQKKRWWHYDDILHILQEIHEQVTPEEILEDEDALSNLNRIKTAIRRQAGAEVGLSEWGSSRPVPRSHSEKSVLFRASVRWTWPRARPLLSISDNRIFAYSRQNIVSFMSPHLRKTSAALSYSCFSASSSNSRSKSRGASQQTSNPMQPMDPAYCSGS